MSFLKKILKLFRVRSLSDLMDIESEIDSLQGYFGKYGITPVEFFYAYSGHLNKEIEEFCEKNKSNMVDSFDVRNDDYVTIYECSSSNKERYILFSAIAPNYDKKIGNFLKVSEFTICNYEKREIREAYNDVKRGLSL